ncbi:hypothetical protein [Endozoicomonas sp. YOMI1]|uniref:hypothetical protein n=1 Tax=Endozoicomonas sp. YOMI1 TaxID=2828739 RepID=UPI002148C57B|nr:hypothetical protein [Endozoicomonas sp. YOMI1]
MLPELSLEDIDDILSCDFASEPVDDDRTDSTLTNYQQIAQKLPSENSLVGSSQPSRPVVVVGPLNKDTQEQVTKEIIEFTAPESSGSGEPMPLTPAAAHDRPGKGKAFRKASAQLEKRRASKQAWAQSEKGKAFRRAWAQSERGKACRRAWEQSERGKANRRAWLQSEKGKAYIQSKKRKAAQKAYEQSEEVKAARKAYQKTYNKAYNVVFRNTGDKEQAKIAGKQATAFVRESNKAKK